MWADVCNIESPTNYKEGVNAVGQYFIQKANERGWTVDVLEEAVSGNTVAITMNPDAKGTPIAVSAHMDTVHPVGSFGTPAVRMEGDRIYGPGVTDCKSGAVAALLAMDALYATGYGVSAIAEAAHKILELEKMKNPDGLTCNCGVITGGTVANAVPEFCSFVADIRFANAVEMQEAIDKVHEVAAHSYLEGTTCEVELVSQRIAMEPSEKNYQLLDRINEISEEVGLPVLTARGAKGGSDAAYSTAAGIPTVDNIAPIGGRVHSLDEYGILSSLAPSAKRLAAIIMGL